MYQRVPSCERRESSVRKYAVSPASVCPRSPRVITTTIVEATSSDHRPFSTLSYGDSHLHFEHATIGNENPFCSHLKQRSEHHQQQYVWVVTYQHNRRRVFQDAQGPRSQFPISDTEQVSKCHYWSKFPSFLSDTGARVSAAVSQWVASLSPYANAAFTASNFLQLSSALCPSSFSSLPPDPPPP